MDTTNCDMYTKLGIDKNDKLDIFALSLSLSLSLLIMQLRLQRPKQVTTSTRPSTGALTVAIDTHYPDCKVTLDKFSNWYTFGNSLAFTWITQEVTYTGEWSLLALSR